MASLGLLITGIFFMGIISYTGLTILPDGVDILVMRDFSGVQIGVESPVVLEVNIRNSSTAIGIEEYAPAGANITNCSEENYRISGNKIEILLFNSSTSVTSKNITYYVVSDSVAGFNGTWESVDPDLNGSITNFEFCGDASCNNGETCTSCLTDCGACESASDEDSGGGTSGGGGGSSGGSATSTTVNSSENKTNQISNFSEIPNSDLEISEENQTENETKESGREFFRNIGNTILGEGNKTLTIFGVILVILILGIIAFYLRKSYIKQQ